MPAGHLGGLPPIRSRGPIHARRLILPLVVLVMIVLTIWWVASCVGRVFAPSPPMTKAEEYPPPWTSLSREVTLTIYREGHRCGEGYQRVSSRSPQEYLVYCREAEGTWTTYLVFPLVDDVLGPDLTFAYTHSDIDLPERSDTAEAVAP